LYRRNRSGLPRSRTAFSDKEPLRKEQAQTANLQISQPRRCARRIRVNGGIGMYAVIRAGGKQYRVAPGDVIRVEKTSAGADGKLEFSDVLAVSGAEGEIARPQSEARVVGEVVEEGRYDRSWSSITNAKSSTNVCADIASRSRPSALRRLLLMVSHSPRPSRRRR